MVHVKENDLTQNDLENGLMDYLSDHDDEKDQNYIKHYLEDEPPMTLDTSFRNTLIVLGLPIVGPDKYDRLCEVVTKMTRNTLDKKGCELQQDFKFEIPRDANNQTKGIAFFTFSSPLEATIALKVIKRLRFDPTHTLKAIMLDNFDNIVSDENTCQPPLKNFGFTREKLRDWWLNSNRMREQFVIRYADQTEIYWYDPLEHEPILAYNGENERAEGRRFSTDQRVEWSHSGSYLAVYRRPGVVLHGCDNFEVKNRFEHRGVRNISFSPGEEYLLTWDGTKGTDRHDNSVCIWRVMTGELLRSFPTPKLSPKGNDFPHFLWSYNGEYIAKLNQTIHGNEIMVYKLPGMILIPDASSKPSPLKYAADKFDWSPTDNIMSIVIPGSLDTPARLLLVEIPSRRELSSRNVYNVVVAAVHWQNRGDCLCLRTTISKKTGKKGRKQYNQLEIFRIRERNIPVDTIQIEECATVKQLHWEEGGNKRFALIVKDEETATHSIRFYRVSDVGATRDTVWITTFDITAQLNHMQWSPCGNYFILGCLGAEGTLFFCTLNDNDKVEVLYKDEHFMMNSIKWSSCGRYLATCVNVPMPSQQNASDSDTFRYSAEAGFCIWTFQGKQMYKIKLDNFYSFDFRPHPPPLLSTEQIDAVRKNLKEYSRKFDALDEKAKLELCEQFLQKRKNTEQAFLAHISLLLSWYCSQPKYKEFTSGWDAFYNTDDWHQEIHVIEEVLDVKEEILD